MTEGWEGRAVETRREKIVDVLGLIGFVALTAAASVVGTWATIPNIPGWYARLQKPSWTPPNRLFGPVWTGLYLLMAVAAWVVWRRRDAGARDRRDALGCWLFQLALNVAWSWIFFGLHNTGLAFVELVSLWLMIAATMVAFAKVDRRAPWFLAPYLLWVTYAGALNAAIHRLNS